MVRVKGVRKIPCPEQCMRAYAILSLRREGTPMDAARATASPEAQRLTMEPLTHSAVRIVRPLLNSSSILDLRTLSAALKLQALSCARAGLPAFRRRSPRTRGTRCNATERASTALFRRRSVVVPSLFRRRSAVVPSLFRRCSVVVPSSFRRCSVVVPSVFLRCSVVVSVSFLASFVPFLCS
jgi:hypothetical protein